MYSYFETKIPVYNYMTLAKKLKTSESVFPHLITLKKKEAGERKTLLNEIIHIKYSAE